MLVRCVLLLLWCALLSGQSFTRSGPLDSRNYPRLSGGEIPLYPAAALSAHLTGVVEIEVTVEDGNVTNATVKRGEHDPPLVET